MTATLSQSPLITPEQIEQFHTLGYCVVADLFTAQEIDDIQEYFEAYKVNGAQIFDSGSGQPNFKYDDVDPKERQVRAMHPHRYDARPLGWFLNPRVAEVLEALLGRPALGAQTMYYYKPPGARGQGM